VRGRVCNNIEEKRNMYQVLVEKPVVRTPLQGHKYRWEYNIKIDLKEVMWRCGPGSSG